MKQQHHDRQQPDSRLGKQIEGVLFRHHAYNKYTVYMCVYTHVDICVDTQPTTVLTINNPGNNQQPCLSLVTFITISLFVFLSNFFFYAVVTV